MAPLLSPASILSRQNLAASQSSRQVNHPGQFLIIAI